MKLKILVSAFILCSHLAVAQTEASSEPSLADQEISEALDLATSVSAEGSNAVGSVKETEAKDAEAAGKLAEDQIALNLESKKAGQAKEGSALNFILGFSIFGILLSGGFYFVRKYSLPKPSRHQTQIKVLQQHYLGPKKSLAIVRVAGESILIGITDQSISHLRTLTLLDEEIPTETPDKFEGVLKGMSGDAQFDDSDEDADQFTIRGIRDVVSTKLKGMRSFE